MTRLNERILYEQAIKQYEQEMAIYRQHVQTQAEKTADKFKAFLSFPEGIWANALDLEMDEFGNAIDLQSNADRASSIGAEATAVPTAPLETDIEEVIDDDDDDDGVDSINSDIEIVSTDLRGGADHNPVLKMQRERKEQDWQQRMIQLDALRRIYVPQFVSLLFSVYADSNNLQECMRIADIVADERHRLHTTYTQEQIVNLLNKLREISIQILTEVPDPLGYIS